MNASQTKRLPVGQLLVRMLRLFRSELFRRMREAGHADLREPHMHVFGNIDEQGTRLTDLAARAHMTRPSMAELVDDLERRGYLERRPDPSDRRAKLIRLTPAGRRLVREALRNVSEMERDYARRVGAERYDVACQALHELITDLTREPGDEARSRARRAGG